MMFRMSNLGVDKLIHKLINNSNILLQSSLQAKIESPLDPPQHVNVSPRSDLACSIKSAAESRPFLVQARRAVKVGSKRNFEYRVESGSHEKVLHTQKHH